jgi:putative ABC transport system permease protein
MRSLILDVFFSYRSLKRRPGFAITAALTVALGICANVALFSVIHALLIRPLPLREPERLVLVQETDRVRGTTSGSCSTRMFLALRERNGCFTHLTAWYERDTNVGGLEAPLQVVARQTTADFFGAMGLEPEVGRGFSTEEAAIGHPRDVAVIGHRLWRQQFGGDPAAIGKTILVDDRPTVIVGVMPPGEQWFDADLVMPLPPYVTNMLDRRMLAVVGRLQPGLTIEAAQAQLQGIASDVRGEFRAAQSDITVTLARFDRLVVQRDTRQILALLSGAAALVLLVACVNLAHLLLARSIGRRREIAIQMAIGAGRSRIMRQLLTESIMLSLLGGALGVLLALWGVDVLRNFGASHIPRLDAVGIYGATLLFTAALALVSGLATGLLPAIQASRPGISEALKEAVESGFGTPARHGLRGTLVIVEVAMALALLVSAGLLLRSAARISRVDPGFQIAGRVAITVNLPRTRYEPDALVLQFWRSLLERVRGLPGVVSATGTSDRWLVGQRFMEFDADNSLGGKPRIPIANVRTVTPGYFKTLGIRLLDGRDFSDQDWTTTDGTLPGGAPYVALVSETLARRQWPGERAVGRKIRPIAGNDRPWCTIIGVVSDVRQVSLTDEPRPFFYLPEFQFAWTRLYLVAHISGDAKTVVPAIQASISALDSTVPVHEVVSLEALRADSQYVPRAITLLVVIFAVLALMLAAVGVYGLLAYSVARRSHEFGVRIALGAGPGDVIRLVVRQGLTLALAGELAGLPLALLLSTPLDAQLYEISSSDPLTYVTVAAFLLLVALVACLIPAWRATRVVPSSALRAE